MGKTKKERMAEFLSLPKEVMHGVLKVTVYGDNQVIVENHSGISEYRSDLIKLKTPQKEVEITGEKLEIKTVTDIDVLIEGEIKGLKLL